FPNASLHSRITNAFSNTGRPRSCTLARLGAIDLRAQTQILSLLRSATAEVNSRGSLFCSGPLDLCAQAKVDCARRTDTPMHFSWKVVQARATVAEGDFPDATEQTLVASGVYTSTQCGRKTQVRERHASVVASGKLWPESLRRVLLPPSSSMRRSM